MKNRTQNARSKKTKSKKAKFQVIRQDGKMVRKNRPSFISSTTKKMKVKKGEEDRRHILHGATQISDKLIDLFNHVEENEGNDAANKLADKSLVKLRKKARFNKLGENATLEKKVEKIITLCFSRRDNLVVGSKSANQGIEKARGSIKSLRKELDEYCAKDLRGFESTKTEAKKIAEAKLKTTSNGDVARYRLAIMQELNKSIENASNEKELNDILYDFEFSCTLDIVHESSTKEQNIWGITMANKLHRASVCKYDPQGILDILI